MWTVPVTTVSQATGEKRAAPDSGKKPKTPKKKKKKDPNEPQKPVSAYALFFRDTQAAIKGQNPNATFGEVSKIVASMWDSLGEEQKQVKNGLRDVSQEVKQLLLVKNPPISELSTLLADVDLLLCRAALIFELAEDLASKKHFVIRLSRSYSVTAFVFKF